MEHSFWHDKWENNQLGFHLDEVHPLLKKYFDKIFSSSDSVFVPLCGKTLDMRYLLSKNKTTIGSELSEIAIKDFYAKEAKDNQLHVERDGEHLVYSSSINEVDSKILVGDFFNLKINDLSKATSIYDRAALVALPSNLREAYVKHLKKLIPKASMLLITLDYDQELMSGPPFSIVQEEVEVLFSFAKTELLKRSNIINEEPHFASKGLNEFFQSAYYIEW